ncbi:MAG TPA: hypothetical protein DEO88_03735 [Syntrophobacteraceae bacterium]|nr:hypothetical protein [Syntrophobacteraceae bacterium]
MGHAEQLTEPRWQQRFKTRDMVFAVLYTDVLLLGKVLDVGRGGLAFQYVAFADGNGEWAKGKADLEVFESGSSRCWKIPSCSVVYDLEVPLEVRFLSNYQLRRCGVRFGDLSKRQCTQVESLIKHLGVDPLSRHALELPSAGERC